MARTLNNLTPGLERPTIVKQFHTSEDKSWYEKDLEEFDSEEQCLKNEEGDTISTEHVGTQREKVPKEVKHGCYYPWTFGLLSLNTFDQKTLLLLLHCVVVLIL
ncbi:uncharacterized protein LOC143247425 isoform X2 [Tachypleus tridentatus]|uniref:uncharacterized protein LOC143247425 isoform X2 n=1 Tax=Tachypleus tridentatus TaxID=6853 RepID=UPI003FD6717D